MNNLFNRGIIKSNKIFHELTYFFRVIPDFLVIGNSFCGKTLLYNYMTQHPLVMQNLREETAYWGWHFSKGENWYRSNFPTIFHKKILEITHKKNAHVGETVNIPVEERPKQIHQILSDPKIIVILRNPVDRAYVRYLADMRAGVETRSFEESLEKPKPKTGILKKMKMNKIEGINDNDSIYITGSIYYNDLKRWGEFFSLDQMLFLDSEKLIQEPLQTVNKALNFLGLESLNSIKKIGRNLEAKEEEIKLETKNALQKIFEPHNKKLFELIGKKYDW